MNLLVHTLILSFEYSNLASYDICIIHILHEDITLREVLDIFRRFFVCFLLFAIPAYFMIINKGRAATGGVRLGKVRHIWIIFHICEILNT